MELPRGQTKFILGLDSDQQLVDWLRAHPDSIGVALVGRSNVGKSSTINTLFGKSTARVSNTPGRTRQINIFEFELPEVDRKFYLYDLPGYGHAEVSKNMKKNWDKLMDAFFSYLSHHILLLNIQDARHPHQASDQEFHSYIKTFPNETFLIINKMDKLKKQSERSALTSKMKSLIKEYKWVKQIYYYSAEKRTGVEELELGIITYLLKKHEANLALMS